MSNDSDLLVVLPWPPQHEDAADLLDGVRAGAGAQRVRERVAALALPYLPPHDRDNDAAPEVRIAVANLWVTEHHPDRERDEFQEWPPRATKRLDEANCPTFCSKTFGI